MIPSGDVGFQSDLSTEGKGKDQVGGMMSEKKGHTKEE